MRHALAVQVKNTNIAMVKFNWIAIAQVKLWQIPQNKRQA
jgi:hypothetical protein